MGIVPKQTIVMMGCVTVTGRGNCGRNFSIAPRNSSLDWPSFLTIDLSLPHRIGHAPEGGQQKEGPALVGVGHPSEEIRNYSSIDGGTEEEDGQAAQVLDQDAEAKGAGRVGDAIGYEDEPHIVHAVRAAAVSQSVSGEATS